MLCTLHINLLQSLPKTNLEFVHADRAVWSAVLGNQILKLGQMNFAPHLLRQTDNETDLKVGMKRLPPRSPAKVIVGGVGGQVVSAAIVESLAHDLGPRGVTILLENFP